MSEKCQKIEATPEALEEDLLLLRRAGFTGLITYTANGVQGEKLTELASALGFKGLIVGIWDPKNPKELEAAKCCASNPIVLGYSVGNEGYKEGGKDRYTLDELSAAIRDLRQATGRKATTTEQIDDYYGDKALLEIGDWVLVNAHPYFHSKLEPDRAVQWTVSAYEDLQKRTPPARHVQGSRAPDRRRPARKAHGS